MIDLRFPELVEHSVAPPALTSFRGIDEAQRELSSRCSGGDAASHDLAMLGNVLVRRGRYVDALEAYRAAADLDPSAALAHWACGEIAHVLDDAPTSHEHRALALALQRVYPDPLPVGNRTPILLLLRDAPYSVNAPLELLLDRSRFAVHKYYVEGEAQPALPPFALAFCAFGAANAARDAARRAVAFLDGAQSSLNDPGRFTGQRVNHWRARSPGLTASCRPTQRSLRARKSARSSCPHWFVRSIPMRVMVLRTWPKRPTSAIR